jgi:hypothetical protein
MTDASDSSDHRGAAQGTSGPRLLDAVVTHLAVLAIVVASVAAVAMRPAAPTRPVAAASSARAGAEAGAKAACRSCSSVDRWSGRPLAHRG